MRRLAVIVSAMAAATACHSTGATPTPVAPTAPAAVLGDFVDDYGNTFAISATTWTQLPHGRLNIIRWNAAAQYLIAQNDAGNRYAPGKWTRIDWTALPDMAPFTWAFCLTAYEAPSAAAAESTTTARRDTPRTGCNGYPFSRMKRR